MTQRSTTAALRDVTSAVRWSEFTTGHAFLGSLLSCVDYARDVYVRSFLGGDEHECESEIAAVAAATAPLHFAIEWVIRSTTLRMPPHATLGSLRRQLRTGDCACVRAATAGARGQARTSTRPAKKKVTHRLTPLRPRPQ
jgi:hypothetical protein